MARCRTIPRCWCVFLSALLVASIGSAAAALPSTGAEPRFFLQAIEVTGTRHVSPDVVVSESLLRAGEVYTESELADAAQRIRRLPFVLEVGFALGKGRERGTYVLTIDVLEARRFFYLVDVERGRFFEPVALGAGGVFDDNLHSSLRAGARVFVGKYAMVFAAGGNEGAQVGFTRYHLFGSNAVLSLGYAAETCCATTTPPLGLDPAWSSWIDEDDAKSATLALDVPLDVHQTVHGSVTLRSSDAGFRRPAAGSLERPLGGLFDYENRSEERLRLAWQYDATDDPVFPFTGTSLAVAVDYRSLEADLVSPAPGAASPAGLSSRLVRLSVLGRRHWPVARRHSFAAGASLGFGRSTVDNLPTSPSELIDTSLDSWDLTATIRHSMRLAEAKSARRFRRVYWVNELEYSLSDTSPGFARAYGTVEVATFGSAVVFRGVWGIVRLGLKWIEIGGVL